MVVVGEKRPFVAALITLDAEMLPGWLRNHGLPPMTVAEAACDPHVLAALDRAVERANRHVSRERVSESLHKLTKKIDLAYPYKYNEIGRAHV